LPATSSIPFLSYRAWLKEKTGLRIQKISIEAGMTCPNRDGTAGKGGCTYCLPQSFIPSYLRPRQSIAQQIAMGKELLRRRYRCDAFYAYFQSYTNTYKPLQELKDLYREALQDPEIHGLVIGTRPDCLEEALLDFLEELNQQTTVCVELGLESSHDQTLRRVNRGHDVQSFEDAVAALHRRQLAIGCHIILGLPGESQDMMLSTADFLSSQPIDSLKIHHLYLVQGTSLAEEFRQRPFPLLSLEDYLDLCGRFLCRLRPDIALQRLVGETHPRHLLAPHWGFRAYEVKEALVRHMNARGWQQGMSWKGES
jgi:hypothetical protein